MRSSNWRIWRPRCSKPPACRQLRGCRDVRSDLFYVKKERRIETPSTASSSMPISSTIPHRWRCACAPRSTNSTTIKASIPASFTIWRRTPASSTTSGWILVRETPRKPCWARWRRVRSTQWIRSPSATRRGRSRRLAAPLFFDLLRRALHDRAQSVQVVLDAGRGIGNVPVGSPAVAVPRAAFELVIMLLHPALELPAIMLEFGALTLVDRQILHLIGIGCVVEEQLGTVAMIHRIRVSLVAQRAPFGAVLPGGRGSHPLQVGGLRAAGGLSKQVRAQVSAFDGARHMQAERAEKRRHDVRRAEKRVGRAGPDVTRPPDEERHAAGLFVEDVFGAPAMRAEHFPVIRRENKQRAVFEAL